jgi:HEAT repeat protein
MSPNADNPTPQEMLVNVRRSARAAWDGLLLQVSGLSERFGGKAGDGSAIGEGAALAGLASTSARERWSSAIALGRNSQRTPEAIGALVGALTDPEEFVRWQAAQALAAQEAGQVFPTLTDLLDDPDPLRRAGAATAMGQLGGEAAALTLSRHLGENDPAVRVAIIEAIGEAGDPTLAKSLTPFLDDPDADVRRAAAHSLGQLGNSEAGDALAATLIRRGQPLLVRRAAAAALVLVAKPDNQPQLLAALADADPQVRAYAARALGQVGSEDAHAALEALKSDRTPVIKGTVGDAARGALTLLEQRGRRSAATAAQTPPAEQMEDSQ